MTNVLALSTNLFDPTPHIPARDVPAGADRTNLQTELSIAATRFEFAVGVGAMLGGLVGLGVGAIGGSVVGAAPASAAGAILGGAALGIPVGVYSLVRLTEATRRWSTGRA